MRFFPAAIQRDILRRFIGPFLFCFSVIVALLIMQFLILFTDRLVGKDLPFLIILELIFSNVASLVVMAIPMSILAASLLVYGRISEWNEFTALRAAGIHPWKVLQPIFWPVAVVSLFMIHFSMTILPEANLEARRLWADIRLAKPGFDVQPGVFYEGIDGYTFLARHADPQTDSLYQITLYRDQGTAGRAVFRADKAHLQSEANRQTLTLLLINGSLTRWMPASGGSSLIEQSDFGTYRIRFDITNLSPSGNNPDAARNDRTMYVHELEAVIDSIHSEMSTQRQFFDQKEHFSTNVLANLSGNKSDSLSSGNANRNHAQLSEHILTSLRNAPYGFLRADNVPAIDRLTSFRSTIESLRSSRLDYENLELNLRWRQERAAQYTVEVYKKYAVPVACLLFFLCGAAIGLLSKRGNLGFAALVVAVLSTIYWVSLIQGEKLADRLFISPLVGMWAGNTFLMILATVLLYRLLFERHFLEPAIRKLTRFMQPKQYQNP